jgi:HEAT repeat protein
LSFAAEDAAEPPAKTVEEQRLDTIKYGTENEIAALIRTLKAEDAFYLDDELRDLAQNSENRNILTEIFSFFGEREKEGLEERALRAIEGWDEEANETVLAAVDYLGRIKDAEAVDALEGLLNAEERRFTNSAFRALGRIGGGNSREAEAVAEYLMDYYDRRNPADESRREIIAALGETGAKEGVPFLADIAGNNDERLMIRQAALAALAKLGDDRGLQAVLSAVSSADPNVRSAAVAALGPFSGPAVNTAILEAFRDSYYRTRIGAAQAAGARKLPEAVPYLAFRVEHDETPAVKDEAIRALGAIASGEAMAVLEKLFGERKNADRIRLLSAEHLILNSPGAYAGRVIDALDEAKQRNQTPLYNGLLRVISLAKTGAVEDLVRRFFASGGVVEKSYALDMTAANNFRVFLDQVQALTDEKNGSLSRKARLTLEKLEQGPAAPPPAAEPAELTEPVEQAAEPTGLAEPADSTEAPEL